MQKIVIAVLFVCLLLLPPVLSVKASPNDDENPRPTEFPELKKLIGQD